MRHILKTWPEHFQAVWDEKKRYELRFADRAYAVDDELRLREYDPQTAAYSEREIIAVVTHVMQGGSFGLADNYVCMSIHIIIRIHEGELG